MLRRNKMVIINSGDPKKNANDFQFSCFNCGCRWTAARKEVKISPPCLPYMVYMNCPNCRKMVEAMTYEEIKKEGING
jgi:hypothetical protein